MHRLWIGPQPGRNGPVSRSKPGDGRFRQWVNINARRYDTALRAAPGAAVTSSLRTANPIESVFATVRHRTVRTKGALSQDTARLMVFKLVMAAAKTWRRLQGENQLPKLIQGVTFKNGVEVINTPAQTAA